MSEQTSKPSSSKLRRQRRRREHAPEVVVLRPRAPRCWTGADPALLPEGHCKACGAPPGYHYMASCVYR